jgi:hypothetical protein
MWLTTHDGKCCGMACIYGFEGHVGPSATAPAITPEVMRQYCLAYPGMNMPSHIPAETALQRLRRVIQHRERARSSGIIEAVLTTQQLKTWESTLADLHFKESCRNLNSNSQNTIVVFHRLSGAEGVDKIEVI